MQADVIIIGAGATGLQAANLLCAAGKKVIVLEARDRIGGRVHTLQEKGFAIPVELGAEFVHGNLPLTRHLIKETFSNTHTAEGSIWRSRPDKKLAREDEFIPDADKLITAIKREKEDLPVADLLHKHFSGPEWEALRSSVKSYVEGYYAGELNRASSNALLEELTRGEEDQLHLQNGYGPLLQHLADGALNNGCQLLFSTIVKELVWDFKKVSVTTQSRSSFTAPQVLITVPVGVLQAHPSSKARITFTPHLGNHQKAIAALGFGPVIKVLLQCSQPFWKTDFGLDDMGFLFSNEAIPTWWTRHPYPSNLLTGWCAGPKAQTQKDKSDAELFKLATTSLAAIFQKTPAEIQNHISAWKVANWVTDPYTCGGYSHQTTETNAAVRLLQTPVKDTLYFAGEGIYSGKEIGTVEGALISGTHAAELLLQASF